MQTSARAASAIGAALIALALVAPASAQTPPSTQELLEQIRLLQKRVEQLEAAEKQRQAADTRTRTVAPPPAVASKLPSSRPAAAVKQEQQVVTAAPPPPTSPPSGPAPAPARDPEKPNGSFMLGSANMTLGGFVDLTGYARSRNENRGTGTAYNSIPFYGPTSQGDTGEFGMSAQQTRVSSKIEAPVGPTSQLTAYLEMDFNNGSGGANSVQSSSYTPRLRHAFGMYDDDSWELLAGQTWSLTTPFKKGLGAFATWQPPTIDHNYMVGYTYERAPLVRAIKTFDNISIGVEANTPQTAFGGSSLLPPGQSVVTSFPGGTGLNPQTNYSLNVVPDLVAKVAVDTGFGHFDAFGVVRWFRDQITYGTQVTNYDTFGGGFGASAFVPIGRWADLMGNVMYGNGIGAYGAGGLADVTFRANGSLTTLAQGMGTVGVIGHVLPKVLDLYAFYGIGSARATSRAGATATRPSTIPAASMPMLAVSAAPATTRC